MVRLVIRARIANLPFSHWRFAFIHIFFGRRPRRISPQLAFTGGRSHDIITL